MTLAPELVDAYLRRLGLDEEPPSVEALFRIHQSHVERVPYETVWIHVGEQWSIDAHESARRIALCQRGGYCFHLNGALRELLRSLGYRVTGHVGGVHGAAGTSEAEMANHLVLTVESLPTDENPDGTWYVDTGLGDALYEPLPLIAGTYTQAPFQLALDRVSGGVGDWHLTHDPHGGFAGMAWWSRSAEADAFAGKHAWLSTAPESHFVKILTAQRRDATGVDVLRGLTLQRIGQNASKLTLTTVLELGDALHDLFGLDMARIGPSALDALWRKTHAAHVTWEAAGRP